jgi:hypothetical protein
LIFHEKVVISSLKTLTRPQLWVPHISLVFGEMWEINLLFRVDPPGFVHQDRSVATHLVLGFLKHWPQPALPSRVSPFHEQEADGLS